MGQSILAFMGTVLRLECPLYYTILEEGASNEDGLLLILYNLTRERVDINTREKP